MRTFEHGDSSVLYYTDFSNTRVHFYAAIYVLLGNSKTASQLYQRAIKTAQKVSTTCRRGTAEDSLQSNSRLLESVFPPRTGFEDRNHWNWQSGTIDVIADLTDNFQEKLFSDISLLCTDIIDSYADLWELGVTDDSEGSSNKQDRYRPTQRFSKSSQISPPSHHLIPS